MQYSVSLTETLCSFTNTLKLLVHLAVNTNELINVLLHISLVTLLPLCQTDYQIQDLDWFWSAFCVLYDWRLNLWHWCQEGCLGLLPAVTHCSINVKWIWSVGVFLILLQQVDIGDRSSRRKTIKSWLPTMQRQFQIVETDYNRISQFSLSTNFLCFCLKKTQRKLEK